MAMKVYVTKYALTAGIRQCVVESSSDGFDYVRWSGSVYKIQCRRGRDSHETLEAAYARARELVAAKQKALRKQARKLEDLAKRFAATGSAMFADPV